MTVAYLFRKFPENFSIACRILSEIRFRSPEFVPKSFLDFGAGLAPGGHAFFDLFVEGDEALEEARKKSKKIKEKELKTRDEKVKNKRKRHSENHKLMMQEEQLKGNEKRLIACVEPNETMRKMGEYLSQDVKNIFWSESLMETFGSVKRSRFDLVYCSFVLEEIPTPERRLEVVQALFEKTEPNGFLVFVLPGAPMGFRFLNDLRNIFRKMPREKASIFAPCPHHFECPLAKIKNNWCRFEQTSISYPKSVMPKRPRGKHVIRTKFCYLIIKKGELPVDRENFDFIGNQEEVFEGQHTFDELYENLMKGVYEEEKTDVDYWSSDDDDKIEGTEKVNMRVGKWAKAGQQKVKKEADQFWGLDQELGSDDDIHSESEEDLYSKAKDPSEKLLKSESKIEAPKIDSDMISKETKTQVFRENSPFSVKEIEDFKISNDSSEQDQVRTDEEYLYKTGNDFSKLDFIKLTKKLSNKSPQMRSYFWQRMVRPVKRKGKHSLVYLCNINGDLEARTIAKSHGTTGGYEFSKSVKWGDLWPFPLRIPNRFRKEKKGGKRLW